MSKDILSGLDYTLAIIDELSFGSNYPLDLDEGKFKWYEDKLELVKFTPKSLLKDGVIVTFRDSTWAFLHDGDFIYKGKTGNLHIYSRVIDYDDNLNAVADIDVMEYDIMKLEFDGEVIWERPKDIIVNFIDSSGNAKPSDIANILEKIKAFAKENNITKATIEIREEDE